MRDVDVVVVGSLGIDTIATPEERRDRVLGGSVSYACAAACLHAASGMVAVAGSDFPEEYTQLYHRLGIDLDGLQFQEGKTFHWEGLYHENMEDRDTILTELNVFADFRPTLPDPYRRAAHVFLANIAPALQLHVLEQVAAPRFVIADTMDLWIRIARDELLELAGRVDLLTLNESEATLLTGERNFLRAARAILDLGPRYALIKKGANGCLLVSRSRIFILPSYPVERVVDPTGAGDSFAGGFIGALAAGDDLTWPAMCRALRLGTVTASFTVEGFSLDRLASLDRDELDLRLQAYMAMLNGE